MVHYSVTQTPFFNVTLLAEGEYLTGLRFGDQYTDLSRFEEEQSSVLDEAKSQINEFFSGDRRNFDLPIKPDGTEFQKKAWNILQKIPFGSKISYEEQAIQIGGKQYSRAVGGANGKNPIPLIIPCHRVVAKSGKLGGFSSGLCIKRLLLDFETARLMK